ARRSTGQTGPAPPSQPERLAAAGQERRQRHEATKPTTTPPPTRASPPLSRYTDYPLPHNSDTQSELTAHTHPLSGTCHLADRTSSAITHQNGETIQITWTISWTWS